MLVHGQISGAPNFPQRDGNIPELHINVGCLATCEDNNEECRNNVIVYSLTYIAWSTMKNAEIMYLHSLAYTVWLTMKNAGIICRYSLIYAAWLTMTDAGIMWSNWYKLLD